MAFNHTIQRIYNDGITNVTSSESVSNDTQINFDGSIAGGSTNAQLNLAFTKANMKSLCLWCDRALTIKTNSTGSPQDTISLTANQAIVWSHAHDGDSACPFSDDVTTIYVTLAAGAAATFKLRSILDQSA